MATPSPGGPGPAHHHDDDTSSSDSDLEFDVETLISPIAPVLPDEEEEQKKALAAKKAANPFAKAAADQVANKRGSRFTKADGTPKHQGVGRFVFKDKLAAAAKKAEREAQARFRSPLSHHAIDC